MNNEPEYKGWLNSPSLIKRAFAIWGHFMVAHLILGAAAGIIAFIIAILVGFSFGR